MDNSNDYNYNQVVVPPHAVSSKVGGSDIKFITRSFYEEMNNVMKDYADPNLPMTLLGITIAPEDKYGTQGTILYNQFLTQEQNAIETLMSTMAFLIKLEQDISKMV